MRALIHRALRSLEYDIHRHDPIKFPGAQLARIIECAGIDLVLDIGGTAGQ